MIVQKLQTTALSDITDCFNLAFSDYIIPFEVTETYLRQRWRGAGVDLSLSLGVFDEKKLVGIIIHGVDKYQEKRAVYNVATGVIPSHRGQRLVQKMYEAVLPELKEQGIEYCGLEVITSNEKAIRAYQKVGMNIRRTLHCYNNKNANLSVIDTSSSSLQDALTPNWPVYHSFLDFQPSWENSASCLNRLADVYKYHELYHRKTLVGFAAVRMDTGYIAQFAIAPDYRRKGFGRTLFHQLTNQFPVLKINNVDGSSPATCCFLKKMGFDNVIDQYEMGMDL